MLCTGLADCEDSVILCLNLSQDNSRLVASNSAGLVMVISFIYAYNEQAVFILFS